MDFQKVLEDLKEISLETGKIVMSFHENPSGVSRKKDSTFVSDADKTSSDFIYSKLKEKYPEIAILDEERSEDKDRFENEFCFFVDPLDSSRGFIAKEDSFSILIGLTKNFRPVLGVCYKPISQELFYAMKGSGAFLEKEDKKEKISVNEINEMSVVVSNSRYGEETENLLKKIGAKTITKIGGSVKIIEVAKGKYDLFVCPKSSVMHLWDLCAPQIILEEAGGILIDLNGNLINYSNKETSNNLGILAASQKKYKELLGSINNG